MRLPKITKYRVAVTAGGTMVWPQMRMMRLNSRMMMVVKPIHSARARDCVMRQSPAPAERALTSTSRMNSSSRRFTLLRMLPTPIPRAVSTAKTSFKV